MCAVALTNTDAWRLLQLEKLFPDTVHCLSPISRNYSSRMAPWKERENISVFLKQCKAYVGLSLSLFLHSHG